MANKQIYQLTTRTFDGDCLVPFDTENTDPSTQEEKPYLSSKTSGDSLADFIANEEEYTNDLTTEDKTLTGAINELLVYALNIADEYDSTSTYDEGDFCLYEGVLYKCLVDILVAEAWTPAHWTSTLIVDEFGGSGGASVTLGTTTPSDASGSNGDLYVQYDGTSYAAVYAYVKINNSWRKFPYAKVVALTQAEYDLITPDPSTLYIITDAQSSYQTKTDANLQTTANTVVGAINELNSGKVNNTLFTPYTETSITISRAQGIPTTVPLVGVQRIGKVCIIAFAHELPARTYAQNEVIWQVNPPPKGQVFSIVALGSAHPSITVLTNGDVRFNGAQTLSQATYIIGQLVYICN